MRCQQHDLAAYFLALEVPLEDFLAATFRPYDGMLIARSDLVTTVPHALALYFSRLSPELVIVRPPFDIAGFDLKQHWHRKFHNDSRSQWIRKQIAQLFNDRNDEWSAGWKIASRSGSPAR